MRYLIPKVFFFLIFIVFTVKSQSSNFHYKIEGQTIVTSPNQVPFWMRSNQYGSIPLSGPSMSMIGAFSKDYDTTKRKLVDWGVGFEGRANVGKTSNLILVEGYAKARFAMFEVKVGRSKDIMGIVDTLLTSGSFPMSGNSLGIPKAQVSIPEFYELPFLGKWIALKGNLTHGWLGNTTIRDKRVTEVNTYFHQKSLYVRLGNLGGKLRFYGGYNDQAFWGNERAIFESYIQTDWQSYQSVLYGKVWADSKVGNHLGSVDVATEFLWGGIEVLLYRQSFYDIGALYYLANIQDGLHGIRFTNKSKANTRGFHWKTIMLEFLNTKNQAGQLRNRQTPSGAEDYYNHYLYAQGWTYLGRGLGTPLVSAANEVREGLPNNPISYFINTRVIGFHGGISGTYGPWNFRAKTTYSRNYGIYDTSGAPYRGPANIIRPVRFSKFTPVGQFSGWFTWERKLQSHRYWGGSAAVDLGNLYSSSFGLFAKLGINI